RLFRRYLGFLLHFAFCILNCVAAAEPPVIGARRDTSPAAPLPQAEKGAEGLKAEIFGDMELKSLKATRIDPKIDFEWNNTAPDKSIGPNNFSIRWTGAVKPKFTETYTFHTISDDGVRLWINDEALIDNWTTHAAFENVGTIPLQAGKSYGLIL